MNFDFLDGKYGFESLKKLSIDAQNFIFSNPSISSKIAREALERLFQIYFKIRHSDIDISSYTIFELLDSEVINNEFNEDALSCFHIVRKLGNIATHSSDGYSVDTALECFQNYIFSLSVVLETLDLINEPLEYVEPTKSIKTKIHVNDVIEEIPEDIKSHYKPTFKTIDFRLDRYSSEEYNRKVFFEALLTEADWPIVDKEGVILPSSACLNFALANGNKIDLTLTGRDGKVLALVIYAKSSEELLVAKSKAISLAKEFKNEKGYYPFIYYSTGYSTYFVDLEYYDKPRKVYGLHTIEELEKMIFIRKNRKDISNPNVNTSIAGREYQVEAIKAVCNAFQSKRRGSVIVMATGTGKTRVSIALADILLKNSWVENILFMADRNSLVRQAQKNFAKILPNITTSMFTGESTDKNPNARIIFSTYQSMINLIDGENKTFSQGRFDLIIIDEAHRSIFEKYSHFFSYFDSLIVGLTATPRMELDKNTFHAFGMNDKPDYEYNLDKAIQDKFLVGFNVQDRTTKLLKRGIKYDDLSQEEKNKIEKLYDDLDKQVTDEINIGNEIINKGTIDLMLNELMTKGLKVDGNSKIGKTIIFSKNKATANLIEERFNCLYPQYPNGYCRVVTSDEVDRYSSIDNFSLRENIPQIVVSVDMLDTGIDVPDVLNLVFFKEVKSKIKFLQMIGRGTRLSNDIFGPGENKKGFVIFDYYDNFAYFGVGGIEDIGNLKSYHHDSINTLIHKNKFSILCGFISCKNKDQYMIDTIDKYKKEYFNLIRDLNNDSLEVKDSIHYVNKYRKDEFWADLNNLVQEESVIDLKILPLLPSPKGSFKEKLLDNAIYTLEAYKAVSDSKINPNKAENKVHYFLKRMLKIKIPSIIALSKYYESLLNCSLTTLKIEELEEARIKIRKNMNSIDLDHEYVIIDKTDYIDVGQDPSKKKFSYLINGYLSDFESNPLLFKINKLEKLTKDEKEQLESEIKKMDESSGNEYLKWLGNSSLLLKIRKTIGISKDAFLAEFDTILNNSGLNNKQVEYIMNIYQYANSNGDIVKRNLVNDEPFTSYASVSTLFGSKIKLATSVIDVIHGAIE